MLLGAQPWAAVELLGPSSHHIRAGRPSQLARSSGASPIQKFYWRHGRTKWWH